MTADAKADAKDVEMKDAAKEGNEAAPPKEEPKTEKEEDDETDKRARITDTPVFNESTFGALVAANRTTFSVLAEASCLLNGARLNVGLKKGRYLIEFKFLARYEKIARVAVCASGSDALMECAGDGSYGFDVQTGDLLAGTTVSKPNGKTTGARRWDIVGLLVNLDAKSENKNTVSLFVNGARASEPVALPEGKTWFPTVCLKGTGAVAVNADKDAWRPPPFKARCIGDASKADVDVLSSTPSKGAASAEALLVVAADPAAEVVEKFCTEKAAAGYTVVNPKAIQNWAAKAGVVKSGAWYTHAVLDSPAQTIPFLADAAPRKFVFALSSGLTAADRKDVLSNFDAGPVKAVVFSQTFESGKVADDVVKAGAEALSLPVKGEAGVESVEFVGGAEKAGKSKFDTFKKKMKLREKETDLKPGDFYKGYMEKFDATKKQMHKATAPKKEKDILADSPDKKKSEKKEEEGKDKEKTDGGEKKTEEEAKPLPVMDAFVEEDWMLAHLRAEMHGLLHAFLEDAGADREGFTPALLVHYYKQYASGKNFYLNNYGLSTAEELPSLIGDTVECDDGLLKPKLPIGSLPEDLVQLTEEARVIRKRKFDAGDETSVLKFQHSFPTSSSKGTSYSKGNSSVYNSSYNNQVGAGGNYNKAGSGAGGVKGAPYQGGAPKGHPAPYHAHPPAYGAAPAPAYHGGGGGGYHGYGAAPNAGGYPSQQRPQPYNNGRGYSNDVGGGGGYQKRSYNNDGGYNQQKRW